MKRFILYLVILSLPCYIYAKETYSVYVNSIIDKEYTIKRWQPTIDLLNKKLDKYHFEIIPVKPIELDKIKKLLDQKKIDFLITQPAIYTQLAYTHGIYRILTMSNIYGMSRFGSVFISNKKTGIKTLGGIKNKTVAAVAPYGFGGWLIGYNKLYDNGIDPLGGKKVSFLGTQIDVIKGILENRYEVGIIQTGILEKIKKKGELDLNDLYLIDAKLIDNKIMASTNLYPEWAFSVAKHVGLDVTNEVFKVLNSIKEGDKEAVAGEYSFWHLPENYTEVDKLFKKFKLGHYRDLPDYSLEDILWISAVLFFISVFIILLIKYNFTKRLKNELLLKNYEKDVILNESGAGILKLDHNMKIVYVNKSLLKILHLKNNNPDKKSIDGFFTRNIRKLIRSIKDGEHVELRVAMKRSRGELFPANLKIYYKKDSYSLLFITDLTDQKTDESEIIKAYDSIDNILKSIIHQWKQPLTGLGFMIEYLEDLYSKGNLDKNEFQKIVLDLNRAKKHLVMTVDDFQSFFNIEQNNNRIDRPAFEFLFKLSEPLLNQYHISYEMDFKEGLFERERFFIDGSKRLLQHALLNIINNSVDAFKGIERPGAYIKLSVFKKGEYLHIDISDNAGGILYIKDIDKIFEPYFTTKEVGNGLGLFIVKSIIEKKLKGAISVKNIGMGLVFNISIPVKRG